MSGPPDSTWNDEDLVRACRSGDDAAWSALVDKYKKLVFSIPAKYRLPPEEATDVFQGVWMDLYRDLPKLERAEALRSWLVTASARRSLLHKKKRQRLLGQSGLDPQLADSAPGVEQLQQEAEREQLLRDSVSRLPPRCQKMIHMLFFEHPPRPYSEVARELGLAEGSIGFIRGRCLDKLRKLFVHPEG